MADTQEALGELITWTEAARHMAAHTSNESDGERYSTGPFQWEESPDDLPEGRPAVIILFPSGKWSRPMARTMFETASHEAQQAAE